MCVVVAKFFPGTGWAVAKNRDQDYVPDVEFKEEEHNSVKEILVMYDNRTKYKEGMNFSGLGIVSTSLSPLPSLEADAADGRNIDAALHMKDPLKAAKFLIRNKVMGFILVFTKDTLYLIEAARDDNGKGEYQYKLREVPKTETVAVTNHGHAFPWAGFQLGVDKKQDLKRKSSESRKKIAEKVVSQAKTPMQMLRGLSIKATNDLQMNIFRVGTKDRQMRTIFQNLLVSSEKKMYVIPIQCKMTLHTDRKYVQCEVMDNKYIKKTYDGNIKYFAGLQRLPKGVVKCIEEETSVAPVKFSTYLDESLRLTLRYHDKLNPKLWTKDQLDDSVIKFLLKNAMKFAKFSGVPADRVHDVVVTGGNANYNYTKYSDIDVHLMCDLTGLDDEQLYKKKAEWTDNHPELKVAGYPLEFYASNEKEPYPKGQGFFSLIQDKWVVVPKHLDHVEILKDPAFITKVEHNIWYIKNHLLKKEGSADDILDFKTKMWKGRSAGLERGGEFSIENLLYKELRNRGWIEKLNDKLKQLQG